MNKETPENELDTNEADSSKPRRKFLKQAALSATGAITFVKVSSGASEGSLPAIVSLLLEDDVLAPELGVPLTIDPIEGEEVQQVIRTHWCAICSSAGSRCWWWWRCGRAGP